MSFSSLPRIISGRLASRLNTHSKNTPFSCAIRFSSSKGNIADVADIVQKSIKDNKVMIFSKSFCPYCMQTKQLFADLGVNPTVFELDRHRDGPEVQSALQSLTGQRTVPNVFINGIHVGGNDGTQRALRSGELQKMLAM
ncbi:unnamed protein product [Ectocarpus fasciculatus]